MPPPHTPPPRTPAARFAVRNLRDVTPAADGRFDLVFSVNTIHHLHDHDRILPHLRSLAAPGGTGHRGGHHRPRRLGLRARSVDLVRWRVEMVDNLTEADGRLHEGSPKARRTRSVPIPGFCAPSWPRTSPARIRATVCSARPRGGLLWNSNFRHYVFDPAVTRAGLAPLTPHDLRDSAASLAVSAGAHVKTIQRMLGHASAAMRLDIYADLFDDDLDAVGERLSDAAGGDPDPAAGRRTQCGPTWPKITKGRPAGLEPATC